MPAAQQSKAPRGGVKLRRCSKDSPYYERQKFTTIKNKTRKATKARTKREDWAKVKKAHGVEGPLHKHYVEFYR